MSWILSKLQKTVKKQKSESNIQSELDSIDDDEFFKSEDYDWKL